MASLISSWILGASHLDLVDNVEGVLKARIREHNLVKGVGDAIGRADAVERVVKVGVRCRHARVAAQHDEAGDADEDEGDDLYDADAVTRPI